MGFVDEEAFRAGGEGEGCAAGSVVSPTLKLFLTDEEMRAMDGLDGILGQ